MNIYSHYPRSWLRGEREGIVAGLRGANLRGDFGQIDGYLVIVRVPLAVSGKAWASRFRLVDEILIQGLMRVMIVMVSRGLTPKGGRER